MLWLEIVCDNCAIGGHGLRDRLDRSAERELTDSAKSGGWLSKRSSAGKPRQDLCPKCRGAFDCKHPVIRIYLNAKGDDVLRCVGCQAVIPCQLPPEETAANSKPTVGRRDDLWEALAALEGETK